MVRPLSSGRHANRGVALMTVLLVVALATIAAVGMASRQQLDIRRSENLLDSSQAYQYLVGAEQWAVHVLARDRRDNDYDTPAEDWATVLPAIPVDGGQITGRIEDVQGRYNLNNLVVNGKPVTKEVERFQRLLAALELEPELAWAVVDWLDPDEDTQIAGGAEDTYYLNLERPYRAANGPMVSISELRLVKGVTEEVYALLAPHVTALPVPTPINMNTASLPVIQSLANGMTAEDAQTLIEARERDGYFTKKDTVLQHPAFAGRQLAAEDISVASQHFLLAASALIGRTEAHMLSLMQRDDTGRVTVLLRTQGDL